MALTRFMSRCRFIFEDATRRLLMDSAGADVRTLSLTRLQSLERVLCWGQGNWPNERESFDHLLCDLREVIEEIRSNYPPEVEGSFQYQAPQDPCSGRGRPTFKIPQEHLSFLMACGFNARHIAGILGVSRRTVYRRRREFHLQRCLLYSTITQEELDQSVQDIVGRNELMGPEAVRAALFSQGIRVQRRRVRSSMVRINPAAAAMRSLFQRPERREYHVSGPNSLWHIDGNHKLIRWRIVIHGAIDGFSRLVVFMRAANNNRSGTVLDLFVSAVARYGTPSRVRTDRGGENNAVCLMMNVFRGFHRGSAIQGRSTHNQRIERLWADLWRSLNNVYYRLFHQLEDEGFFDVDNELHLWALHYVYLPRINRDLELFVRQWNNHGLRTERFLSPLQLFVRGCLERRGQQSTAMQDIFQPSVPTAAHSSTAEPPSDTNTNTLDWSDRVEVLQVNARISQQVREDIEHRFDPLGGPMADYGIEILCNIIMYLTSQEEAGM